VEASRLIADDLIAQFTLIKEPSMAQCEVRGNDYDKSFELIAAGARHTFDSFPVCEHCGCKVIGHGVEVGKPFFCCANCARSETPSDVKDRAA
jgi:hypothetical protein